MKGKRIYFVRHGQTVWNVENKICGSTDIGLTELGHSQAVETGKNIVKQGISADEILYSPLIRARDTALHISQITGIPAREEPRLIEQCFGKYEATARDGEEFAAAKAQFINRYDGGESMLHLAQRIYNLLDDLKNDNKTYILVAHNGIARVVNSYFNEMTNEEYAAFGVKNCEILSFEYPDAPTPETAPRLRISAFGNFEAYINDEPLIFRYSKTKELLAYLVDRKGTLCTTRQIISVIWDDSETDKSSYFQNIRRDLIATLRKSGCENVLCIKKGSIGIRMKAVECDYYDYLAGKNSSFCGEYMSQYTWSEYTLGRLEK